MSACHQLTYRKSDKRSRQRNLNAAEQLGPFIFIGAHRHLRYQKSNEYQSRKFNHCPYFEDSPTAVEHIPIQKVKGLNKLFEESHVASLIDIKHSNVRRKIRCKRQSRFSIQYVPFSQCCHIIRESYIFHLSI